jgi:hypothetical protein
MKKRVDEDADEMRPEYDLSKLKFVGRGIYAERYRSGTNLVLLDSDVREAFPDDKVVNETLRAVAKAKTPIRARENLSAPKSHFAFSTSCLIDCEEPRRSIQEFATPGRIGRHPRRLRSSEMNEKAAPKNN